MTAPPAPPDDTRRFSVLLQPLGLHIAVPAALPLVAAARVAGVTLPSSCRNGTCRACLCRLVAGQVRYRIEWPGLSAEEKADGWILPCVAHADSDLELVAPDARAGGPAPGG